RSVALPAALGVLTRAAGIAGLGLGSLTVATAFGRSPAAGRALRSPQSAPRRRIRPEQKTGRPAIAQALGPRNKRLFGTATRRVGRALGVGAGGGSRTCGAVEPTRSGRGRSSYAARSGQQRGIDHLQPARVDHECRARAAGASLRALQPEALHDRAVRADARG